MFRFAWPFIFLILPFIFLVLRYMPGKKKSNSLTLQVPFLSRANDLQKHSNSNYTNTILKKILYLSAWTLLIIAAANPQWVGAPFPIKQDARNIMLAVDLSRSMEIPDLQNNNKQVTRLQTVKEVASKFINEQYGDKFGLILFGSNAFLQTPLTFDRSTIINMLDDATIGLAGDRTAIGDAIGLSVKRFKDEALKSRILILFTDGSNNSGVVEPEAAAKLAKDNNIKIYTIGIGSDKMLIKGVFRNQIINPSASLDEELLKKISTITNGKYFRAHDEKALVEILASINEIETIKTEKQIMRPVISLFYWPLVISLLLFSIFIFPFNRRMA